MSRRSLLVGVLAWLAVVVVTSVITWTVIDAAGQQVLTTSDLPTQARPPEPDTRIDVPTQSPAPRGSRSPHASPSRPPSSPRVPTSGPAAPPSSSAPRTPTPTHSAPSQPAQPQQSPDRSVQRTWQGGPGTTTVRCSGSRASLQSATPNDGYRVEVGGRGPGEVEVTFQGGGRQVQVTAVCVSGGPRFSTETETSDD